MSHIFKISYKICEGYCVPRPGLDFGPRGESMIALESQDTRALQPYLGHKNIQHTVHYTELSPTRFKDFWRA